MFPTLCHRIAVGGTSITTILVSITAVTTGAAAGTVGTWTTWTARIILSAGDVGECEGGIVGNYVSHTEYVGCCCWGLAWSCVVAGY